MAINIFPLRIGELIRPWFLSKETGVRGSAALGTLVLERAIDFTTLALIGALVLLLHTKRLPDWVQAGSGRLCGDQPRALHARHRVAPQRGAHAERSWGP